MPRVFERGRIHFIDGLILVDFNMSLCKFFFLLDFVSSFGIKHVMNSCLSDIKDERARYEFFPAFCLGVGWGGGRGLLVAMPL